MSIHGMERITDAIGYLVLKEDGAVISVRCTTQLSVFLYGLKQ